MEGDPAQDLSGLPVMHFNPLPPHGGRLTPIYGCDSLLPFQSTPSAWRETSVHNRLERLLHISIHSLRMEGDTTHCVVYLYGCTFQSTPSAWRETAAAILNMTVTFYFNPLPPHGGRQQSGARLRHVKIFQSTPSAWRETHPTANVNPDSAHFNPLPPHGGRPSADSSAPISVRFQSTPSAWRETVAVPVDSAGNLISIHSLRMEGDQVRPAELCPALHFNPLPPHGGRLFEIGGIFFMKSFQSTPSAWRETGRPNSIRK